MWCRRGVDDSPSGDVRTKPRWTVLVATAVVVVTAMVFLSAHLGGGSVTPASDSRTPAVDPAVSLRAEGATPPPTVISPSTTTPSTSTPTTSTTPTGQVPTTVVPSTPTTPATPPTTTPTTSPTTTEAFDGPTCPAQGLFPGSSSSLTSGPIVPTGAQSAVVCDYSWNAVALHVTSTLGQSSPILTGGALATLIDEVDASGPEFGSTPSSTTTTTSLVGTGVGSSVAIVTPEYELFFSYPAGGVVAFGLSPLDLILSQLSNTPTDTEGALWVPSPGLLTEVSSYFS
jgi:hypothetical protein